MSNDKMEMPRYKCHKEVWALKIAKIELHTSDDPNTDGGATITPIDGRYSAFHVNRSYVQKHNPKVGGYYVLYQGGYESFSPAEAFEDGYTLTGSERLLSHSNCPGLLERGTE